MKTYKVLPVLFLSLLASTSRSNAMLSYVLSPIGEILFGPRTLTQKNQKIPKFSPPPDALSAQASTLAHSEEQIDQDGQRMTGSTLMPHCAVQVPPASRGQSDLAQEISAIDLPNTIEEALKRNRDTDGPVFVNINLNGQTITKSSAVAHSTQMGDTVDWLKKIKGRTAATCQSTLEWIRTHKKRFVLYCLGGTYCSVQLYLWYLGYMLQKGTCWSRWKNQCSLEELYRFKQTDLVREILEEGRRRLQTTQDPDDGILLMSFVNEANRELSQLKTYKAITNSLERLYVSKIFFFNTALSQEAPDRINRLLFIKSSILAAVEEVQKDPLFSSENNTN